jgi:outer membrane protein TolC
MSNGFGRYLTAGLLLIQIPLGAANFPYRFSAPPVDVKPVQGITERVVDGKLHLRLKDFLELVLKNNTAIALTRLDVYTAADAITAAKAPYDPQFTASFQAQRSVSPQFTQISGAPTLSDLLQTSSLNYQQVLPTGETVTAGYTAVRSSSNDAFDFLNPNTFGTLSIQILQPLWRDRNNIENSGPLQIARSQLQIRSEASAASIADTVATAATQYWSAIRDRDNIGLQQQTYDRALKSYAHDKQSLELGAIASLDIFQSQSQVADRKRGLVEAEYTYKASLDGLRRLIGADLTPQFRAVDIVLEDDPSALPPRSEVHPFEQALEEALRARPEVSAAHRQIGVDDINAAIASNALKPRLDLIAQGSGSGLNGASAAVVGPLGITTPAASTGFGTTLSQTLSFAYPTYGGQLNLTLPFRNSSASAQLSDALVNKTRDRYNERQVQQQVTLDVRQAINAIELAAATIEAAITARDLSVKNVEAEQQKYELGSITAFELLDSQNQLAASESALLDANVVYQQAWISYQRATWTLLDGLGMVVDPLKVK